MAAEIFKREINTDTTLTVENKPADAKATGDAIDAVMDMIPTVPTNVSAFTNDSGYLTLTTLPVYDGGIV